MPWRRILLLFLCFIVLSAKADTVEGKRNLDIVFCLDLSGSTNGLINDVRENLWHIINQVNQLEPQPSFRIAVVGFSRPSFKRENGYVKIISDFTTDYDLLSHELYRIRSFIEKGDQFVGIALNTCITRLNWNENDNTKKIIYIVGNGYVGTNNNDYLKSCELAVKRNIIVNAIFVVSRSNKAQEWPGWNKIARLSKGLVSEMTLGKTEEITDSKADLQKLFDASRKLNLTYLYHGVNGYRQYRNFREADSIAYSTRPAVFLERAYFKNSSLFKGKNAKWDMVDYLTTTGTVPSLNDTLLIPDTLRKVSFEAMYIKLQEYKIRRQQANSEINILLKNNLPEQIHRKFKNGELTDNNIFSRCVINMLVKEWN